MFRDKIKSLRRQKDLSQAALAEMCGVTQGSVSHWEKGRAYPEMPVAHKLCSIFNVSISELLDGENTNDQIPSQEKAPADDPLTEQIMAKAQKMSDKERLKLLKLIDLVVEGEL